ICRHSRLPAGSSPARSVVATRMRALREEGCVLAILSARIMALNHTTMTWGEEAMMPLTLDAELAAVLAAAAAGEVPVAPRGDAHALRAITDATLAVVDAG